MTPVIGIAALSVALSLLGIPLAMVFGLTTPAAAIAEGIARLGNVLLLPLEAAILHLFVRVLGARRQPFRSTLRVCVAALAPAGVGVVPLLGGMAASIWGGVIIIVGLAHVHARRAGWALPASVVAAVTLALGLRAFVAEAFKIPSGAMIPTLAIGDQIFVNKYVYGLRIPFTAIRMVNFSAPARGEVVVFKLPVPPYETYIKRVVGVAGDEIVVRGGVLKINGQECPHTPAGTGTFWDLGPEGWRAFETAVYEETLDGHHYSVLNDPNPAGSSSDFGPYAVPEGAVFVMGDNRDNSFDSRMWGPVPTSHVFGRPSFVWWSYGPAGLDFSRIGKPIE